MKFLFEDPYMLVCEKPASMLSEPDGSGKDAVTLSSVQAGCTCYPVHRLDRNTGGALLLAKSSESAALLSRMAAERKIDKVYLAVTENTPDEPSGEMRDLLLHDGRKNKTYVVGRMRKGVREALLDYALVRYLPQEGKRGISLLKVRLHTGRTHQIRAQFSSRSMPLLGDGKYGSTDNHCACALWCHSLRFVHPFTGEELCITSLPPEDYPWTLFREETEQMK